MKQSFARLLAGSILAVSVHAAWAQTAPVEAPIRFEISRFEVVGNTVLPADVVNAAVNPFAGANRDFGDVQRALEALEKAYHSRGYKLVAVELPEQELNGGVVQLKVVQTKIARVTVSGNKFFDEANIRRSLPDVESGKSPNLNRVSVNLKTANENPAKKVNLKLTSGDSGGEVNALLEVRDEKPWKAMLNIDNGGSKETGKTHVGVVLQHANLFGLDHVASVQYTTTAEEPSKVSVWGAGYHIPFYSTGDSADLYASYSDVNSAAVLAGIFDLAISGKGTVFGGRYNHVMDKIGEYESRIVAGWEVKAYKNSVVLFGEDFGKDVTVRPFSLGYSGTLPVASGNVNFSVTAVRNIPGGSNGKQADIAAARPGAAAIGPTPATPTLPADPGWPAVDAARADFSILRVSGAFNYPVGSWQFRTLMNAQMTSDALVPGEQFGAGGASSVRGFDERALATDTGVLANIEAFSPNFCGKSRWSCRMVFFYDTAHGRINDPHRYQPATNTISSTGLGVRLAMGDMVNLQVDYGHVLRLGSTGVIDKNKLHFRLGFAY